MDGREHSTREDPARVPVEPGQKCRQWPLDLGEEPMLLLDKPLRQRAIIAHAVLEKRPPADRVGDGKFKIGKGEPHHVVEGIFR